MKQDSGAPSGGTGLKMAHAGLWAIGARLSGKLIDFFSLLFLASLLVPADFGVVALAMTVILLIEALTEMPVSQPILRAPEPQRDHYDTAFTLAVMRALVVGALVLAVAWPVAAFYDEPKLPTLLIALALAPMMRGCMSPRMEDFVRRFELRPNFWINLAGKVGALAAVVAVGLTTRSYWSIAVGTIVAPCLVTILSYFVAPYRPRFGLRKWKDFIDVLGWSSVAQLFNALNFQLDRIMLGRILPPAAFGQFSMASDLCGLPFQGLLVPLFGPLARAFEQAKTLESRQQAWLQGLNAVLFVVGPVLMTMAVFAEPLVEVLLGDKWRPAAPYLSALAIAVLPNVISHTLAPLALATYSMHMVALRALVAFSVKLPLLLIGIAWGGVWGAIVANGISNAVAMIYALAGAGAVMRVSIFEQIHAIRRTIICMIVFVAVGSFFQYVSYEFDINAKERIYIAFYLMAMIIFSYMSMIISNIIVWNISGRPKGVESMIYNRLITIFHSNKN